MVYKYLVFSCHYDITDQELADRGFRFKEGKDVEDLRKAVTMEGETSPGGDFGFEAMQAMIAKNLKGVLELVA